MYLYTTFQVGGHVFVYYGSSDQSCICILRLKWSVMYLYTTFKWSVMYLYTTVQVSSHVLTSQLNRSIQIHYRSLEPYYTNKLALTWTVVYKYMTDHLNRSIQIHDWSLERSIHYLYNTVQVIGNVFVYYDSTERLCICILWFKWAVMYLYTTVQPRGHVFVYYGSSER
jgi:hypothetical protein